jgi:hypothetical protein
MIRPRVAPARAAAGTAVDASERKRLAVDSTLHLFAMTHDRREGSPATQYLLAIGRSMAGNLVRISVP